MMALMFTTHLHGPTGLYRTFSLYKPGSIFITPEAIFETLVYCLSSASLTELNSFLVLPPLVSLPLDSVSSEWPILVCLGPQEPHALAALTPATALGIVGPPQLHFLIRLPTLHLPLPVPRELSERWDIRKSYPLW